MDADAGPHAAHGQREIGRGHGEAEGEGQVEQVVRHTLLAAPGDQVRNGEDDHRDPHGALGPVGEALQEVAAHDRLLPDGLRHVAQPEGVDDYEPQRHRGEIPLEGTHELSGPEEEEDRFDAAEDAHCDPGSRQEGEHRATVEGQARCAQGTVIDVTGEQEGEQEIEGEEERPYRYRRHHGDQGVVRGESLPYRGDEVCQRREEHGCPEGGEGEENARPPGRAATDPLLVGRFGCGGSRRGTSRAEVLRLGQKGLAP